MAGREYLSFILNLFSISSYAYSGPFIEILFLWWYFILLKWALLFYGLRNALGNYYIKLSSPINPEVTDLRLNRLPDGLKELPIETLELLYARVCACIAKLRPWGCGSSENGFIFPFVFSRSESQT